MAFGALITLENGNPFITPETTPMALYQKVSVWSTQSGLDHQASASVTVPGGTSFAAFGRTSVRSVISASRSGNTITVSGINRNIGAFLLEVYIFAVFPQTKPQWGMAIWDAAGKLILTNETRVLSDLTMVGTPGQTTGGTAIDTTLPGKWAVAPMVIGAIVMQTGTAPGGQPVIQTFGISTGCFGSGGNTRFAGASWTTATGPVIGSMNSGVALTAINTANYD